MLEVLEALAEAAEAGWYRTVRSSLMVSWEEQFPFGWSTTGSGHLGAGLQTSSRSDRASGWLGNLLEMR